MEKNDKSMYSYSIKEKEDEKYIIIKNIKKDLDIKEIVLETDKLKNDGADHYLLSDSDWY